MPKSNKKQRKIYLDYASSALSASANPGAIHELGLKEKNKLEKARKIIAQTLGAHGDEIIFTSGATESNNLAILGLIHGFPRPHIVTTNIEHASVLEVCRHLEKTKQAQVIYVPVEKSGIANPKKIRKALRKNTVLVSVMYANNEIGTIQPIQEIAKEIRHYNKTHSNRVFFHTDATQAMNYLPVNVERLGIDLMSWNGVKTYGPKGIGALYKRRNVPLGKIMFGGNQEFGLRPGTENPALTLRLAQALETAEKIKDREKKRLTALPNYFFKKLNTSDFHPIINGDLKERLPNNINITIPNIPSDLLVIELNARGIMASAKSACKAGDNKASHVIQALQVQGKALHSEQDGSLRFSLGRDTTKQEIDYTVKALSDILIKLKRWYN